MSDTRDRELDLPAGMAPGDVVERVGRIVVQRAVRDGLPVVVALSPAEGPDDDARFRRDVRALDAALRGPGYLPIADVLVERGARAIVRPWIEGASLLGREKKPLLDALAALDPVARALGRAHRAGVGHGAIAPSRIVVGEHGVVLVDLAFAATVGLSRGAAYSAPEQLDARGSINVAAVDVYGLALLFIALASGSAPFGDARGHDLYARVVDRARRPSLAALGVAVAPAIDRVLERALAVDPETRFANADLLWDALRTAVFAAPGTDVEPPRPRMVETVSPPRRRAATPPASIVIGASIALIAIGFGVEAAVSALRKPPEGAPATATSPSAPSSPESSPAPSAPPTESASVVASAASPPAPSEPPEMVKVPAEDPELLVDRTEVTVRAYRACVEAGACTPTHKRSSGYDESDPERREWLCNYHRRGRDEYPVNCIKYAQANAYCAFVGKRLPSAAEWTRAARGESTQKFPWGDSRPRCREVVFARYGPDKPGCNKQPVGTAPADSHPASASPFGALDMAGSLWEWTTELSPRGFPYLRGGAWDSSETGIAIDSRLEQAPSNGDVHLGFRCVKDARRE